MFVIDEMTLCMRSIQGLPNRLAYTPSPSGRLPGGRPGLVDLMNPRPPSVTPLSQKRRSPTRVICLVRIQTGPYRSVYS